MTRRRATTMLRALFGALLCLVTLAGIARAGSSYLYCAMAGTVGGAPCCKHGRSTDADPGVRAPEMECCRRQALPPLPVAERGAPAAKASDARVTSVLPALPLPSLTMVSSTHAPRILHARAGPRPPPYASDLRASLMIFLC